MPIRFRVAVWCALAACAAPVAAQDASVLDQVRRRMADNLNRLPDYTCRETIERTERPEPGSPFRLIDILRLEVGLVGGTELFSWPGDTKFEDHFIERLAPGGSIGNGTFALHAKQVFRDREPEFSGPVEETGNGRRLLRWDFVLPQDKPSWRIQAGLFQGDAGTRGAFWADAETLDVVRLEAEAVGLPPQLALDRVHDSVTYSRVGFGQESFLLPQSAEMLIRVSQGVETLNRVRFSACRQYTGQSELHFGDDAEAGEAGSDGLRTVELPPGIPLSLVLDTPIRFGTTATGDPITFRLEHAIQRDGVSLPKGSIVSGRITMLRNRKVGMANYVVGIQLLEIRTKGLQAPVHAVLDPRSLGVRWMAEDSKNGLFLAYHGPEVLSAGAHLVWRTRAQAAPPGAL